MNTATKKPSAAARHYNKISNQEKYSSIRWIANVLFVGGKKPATRLAALIKLVDEGREIAPASFIMPYIALIVDGTTVVTSALLDRKEIIPYTENWYKVS